MRVHELSLCNAIYQVVDRAAEGRAVATVHLDVGRMRQVVPKTLRYCWGLVTETTPFADAELDINHIPVRLRCRDCGTETTLVGEPMLLCGQCGRGQVDLLTGEEFMITSLDLKENDDG